MVVILCGAKALMHLALANRYGYHGDELYFLECGRRFAFGYVDHPPLIPWIPLSIARIHAPLARPWDSELPVYVCREPHGTMADLWPEVRRFGHLLPTPPGWPGQPDPSDAK